MQAQGFPIPLVLIATMAAAGRRYEVPAALHGDGLHIGGAGGTNIRNNIVNIETQIMTEDEWAQFLHGMHGD